MDNKLSWPERALDSTGTPKTGSGVAAAIMPGRCAAPPAPATITRSPRPAADSAYSSIRRGVRCAETTCASHGTANSSSAVAAGCIVGQSESLPITMPTSGSLTATSSVLVAERERGVDHAVGEVPGGGDGAGTDLPEVVPECGHVAELSAWALTLPVPVQLDVGPVRHEVVHPLVEAGPGPARRRGRP